MFRIEIMQLGICAFTLEADTERGVETARERWEGWMEEGAVKVSKRMKC